MLNRSLLALLLPGLLFTLPLQAEEGTLRFQIQIEKQLLDPDTAGNPPAKLVPCPIAFVVLDERRARRKPYGESLKSWLDQASQPTARKRVTLEIENGEFVPRLMAIRTGDLIVQGKDVRYLAFETFANSAFGVLSMPGATYHFQQSESALVKFHDTVGLQVGYLTVKDHPYSAISDAEGKVTFTGLPRDTKLPMRVMCPLLKGGTYRFTSDDVEFTSLTSFVVTMSAEEVTEVTLFIRKKDPAPKPAD